AGGQSKTWGRRESSILDVTELAMYLRLPKKAVQAMADLGTLPGRNVGGEWRFHRRAIAEWLNQPSSTSQEIAAPASAVSR
ncbi:MAG TPA: helix-turn-helix domain-containing protein, partial [Pirellulales bacterium]